MANANQKGKRIRARHPIKGTRMRVTAKRLAKLLYDDPDTLATTLKALGTMLKEKTITPRSLYRILNMGVSYTTFKSNLRQFSKGEIIFGQLMQSAQSAQSRKVPKRKLEAAVKCKKGEFYKVAEGLAKSYKTPGSFVTALTIRRMKYLKMSPEEIAEAEDVRWGIHHQTHKWHYAKNKGNMEAMLKAKKKMLELERIFTAKFTRKL